MLAALSNEGIEPGSWYRVIVAPAGSKSVGTVQK
jgi:hypothetical protein